MMKIAEMYRRSNGTHGNKRCGDCPNLITVTDGKIKKIICRLYAEREEDQTDWSGRYPACAWFGKSEDDVKKPAAEEKMQENAQISLSDLFPDLIQDEQEAEA